VNTPSNGPCSSGWNNTSTEITERSVDSGAGGSPYNEEAWRLKHRVTRHFKLIYAAVFMPWVREDLIVATVHA